MVVDDQSTTEGSSSNIVSQLPLLNACDDHWSWNPKDLSHEVRLSGPKHRFVIGFVNTVADPIKPFFIVNEEFFHFLLLSWVILLPIIFFYM